jgi:hypothetical protein
MRRPARSISPAHRSEGCNQYRTPNARERLAPDPTQPDRLKLYRARCKLDGPSSGSLHTEMSTCPVDDGSVDASEQTSATSTGPLLIALLSPIRGLRSDFPRQRRRKARDFKSSWQLPNLSVIETVFGKHHRGNRDDTRLGFGAHEGTRQIKLAQWTS